MKVYIGPYRDWFGLYQLFGLLTYIGVDKDKTHDWAHATDEKFPFINEGFNWIYTKFVNRKIKIRLDNYDTWSMDHTLALIILPMLKQLRATQHGACGSMEEFAQTSSGTSQFTFPFYAEGDDAAWAAGHARWEGIMDEMIWAFEQITDDNNEDQFWIEKPEIDFDKYPEDEGQECVQVRWKNEGVFLREKYIAHQARISAGLELFGKYYQGLWD